MSQSILRPALVLGSMSALGPFTIDMYLPALPVIGAALGADAHGMQATLTVYFTAFGLAQLIYGPWSDRVGRRRPLYAGLALFALGTVLCSLAPSLAWLVFGRLVQGLGAGALGAIPRAIVRDQMTGHEATRMMAAIMLVFSVSPMLAPLAGSALLPVVGWRGIFASLLLACLISTTALTLFQPETLPPERRRSLSPAVLARGLGELFSDRNFMLLTLVGAVGFGSFMIFLSSASYVYTQSFGLTPTQFSLAFACNAIFFFSASQAAARLAKRFGLRRVLTAAAIWFFLVDGTLFALALAGPVGLATVVLGLGLGNLALGVIIPNVMVMALDGQGDKAGLAASLGGTLQTVAAAALAAAVGPFLDGTAPPMLGGIAAAASLCLGLTLWAVRGDAQAASRRRPG